MTLEATPAPQAAIDAAPVTPPARKTAVRGVRRAVPWIGLVATVTAGVLLFCVFEAMPFLDLPAHAGLIAMRHRYAASPFEQRYFVYAPHIGPYSVFRFLGEVFVRVVGPGGAVRALAVLPVVATPMAVLFARRRLQGDRSPTYGYFGVILSFGLMTLLGFASYLLGIAVMLVGLTLWLELMVAVDERSAATWRRELVVAAYAPLVFVAHGHAFLLLLVLAGVSALATGDRVRRALRWRALAPAVALAAWVAWIERGSTTPAGSAAIEGNLTPHFQSAFDKLTLLVTPTLMTRSGVDIVIGLIVWALLLASVAATVRWLRRGRAARSSGGSSPSLPCDPVEEARARSSTRALLACMATIAAIFLALPHQVGWFGFVDGRLVPIVLLLGFMAVRTEALGSWLRFGLEKLGPVFAGAILVVAFIASYRFQEEARGYKEVLAAVPAQSRLLNLPVDPNSDVFTGHPFVHYDKLALCDRPLVVSDVWFHQGSALYPRPENPALRLPPDYVSSDLHGLDWSTYRLDDWDYVLVRTRPGADAPVAPRSLTLVQHRGGWWLYRSAQAVSKGS